MNRKLLININAFYLLLDNTVSQYYQPIMSQFQYNPYQNLQSIPSQYSNQNENNKWNVQEKNYEYNDDDPEGCSCDDCENLKPSCRNMCPNCFPSPPIIDPMASSYMFVQYPYIYPPSINLTASTHQTSSTEKLISTSRSTISTSTTTTQETTTTTIEETTHTSIFLTPVTESVPTTNKTIDITRIPVSMHIRMKDKSPYAPTTLRRTKPNWIPKYGIVPISDQFAEKLIFQMRNMKVLHPRRNNLRNVDDITP